jgi:PhzF family phenazine biosynthesis protein
MAENGDGAAPREREFRQVDVFTAEALRGNPLAVVLDADGLDDARMAAFARWTNLSETTFLLPPTHPQADYRVRIFTPGGELPFAGHPTLGSCHAWLSAGGRPKRPGRVVQECGIGLVPLRTGRETFTRLAFRAPQTTVEPVDPGMRAAACGALGLPPSQLRDIAWLCNGPRQLALLLADAAAVAALRPDPGKLKSFDQIGVIGPYPAGEALQFEVRFFAVPLGVPEDPVTGSLHANLAHWLIDSGRAPAHYLAAQGQAIGRAGRVHVLRDDEGTWIGGDVAPCIAGRVHL